MPADFRLWSPESPNLYDFTAKFGGDEIKGYFAMRKFEKLGDFAARGLSGSVYTQTTDIEHEINGLMTYDRKVLKYDPAVLRAAHEAVIRRMKGN